MYSHHPPNVQQLLSDEAIVKGKNLKLHLSHQYIHYLIIQTPDKDQLHFLEGADLHQ